MRATFLVDLDVGSDTDFNASADDILHACEQANLDVKSVKPWARTQTLPGVLPSPAAGQPPAN